jgi:hypothetical protein
MKIADDAFEMLRLKALDWRGRRTPQELDCSHRTVKQYVEVCGVKPFLVPTRGDEAWTG